MLIAASFGGGERFLGALRNHAAFFVGNHCHDRASSATFRHALTFLTGIHCVPGSDAALIAIEPADPLTTDAVCYSGDRKGHDQYERGHGQRQKSLNRVGDSSV
jgi:hypothetical protein